jgi:hypothetical protein
MSAEPKSGHSGRDFRFAIARIGAVLELEWGPAAFRNDFQTIGQSRHARGTAL